VIARFSSCVFIIDTPSRIFPVIIFFPIFPLHGLFCAVDLRLSVQLSPTSLALAFHLPFWLFFVHTLQHIFLSLDCLWRLFAVALFLRYSLFFSSRQFLFFLCCSLLLVRQTSLVMLHFPVPLCRFSYFKYLGAALYTTSQLYKSATLWI